MSAGAVRFDDARLFYDAVRPALAPREIENNLLLGTARHLADSGGKAFLLAIQSPAGIEAACLRWAPYDLSISTAERPAIERLADAVRETGETVPEVIGPKDSVAEFAERWTTQTGQAWQPRVEMLLYTLTAVTPPQVPVPGILRLARAADREWATEWSVAFAIEAKLPEFERDPEHAARTVRSRIAHKRLFVWENGGRPTTVLFYTSVGLSGARIGGVMTAPDARRNGFGSAAVVALSQKLLDEGKSWSSLFADAENPQSNRIYQRLGYREACRFLAVQFL